MIIAQIFVAWVYSHIFEYVAHRYFLHNRKLFKFAFKNHFATHHRTSRKNEMYDEAYESLLSSKFEVGSLLITAILHTPIAFVFPWAYATLVFSVSMYYLLHRKSHTDVEWGKKWLPWHYAHHMGKDQHVNWGVRLPVVDYILGTSRYRRERA